MKSKKDLSVFNGIWKIKKQSKILSQTVWENGNYQMVFTNNIFGKYGQGWVARSQSLVNGIYEQYFAIKTNGSPWDKDAQIIYANILTDIPNINVNIDQFGDIILIDEFKNINNQYIYEFSCLYNSYINIKLAYLSNYIISSSSSSSSSQSLSQSIIKNILQAYSSNLPEGLSLISENNIIYLRGIAKKQESFTFDVNFINRINNDNLNYEIRKNAKIEYNVFYPITLQALQQNAKVSLSFENNNEQKIYYNICEQSAVFDDSKWQQYSSDTLINLDQIGKRVCFKGNLTSDKDYKLQFSTGDIGDGKIKLIGSPMSFYGYQDNNLQLISLFENCINLQDASGFQLSSLILKNQSYKNMFKGCTSLIEAPELPSTTLFKSCYESMFQNCTSLENTIPLLAETLVNSCYKSMFKNCIKLKNINHIYFSSTQQSCCEGMFYGCVSLVNIPQHISYATLSPFCYKEMFKNCTSIESVYALESIQLQQSCYQGMFEGCTSLKYFYYLYSEKLAKSCFRNMFYGCTSLINIPELAITELAESCYSHMFSGCTSLVNIHDLPATTLVTSCYESMFSGCSNLNRLKVNFTTWVEGATTNWLSGVNAEGVIDIPVANELEEGLEEGLEEIFGESYIPETWGIAYNTGHYFKLKANAESFVSLNKNNTSIYYNLSNINYDSLTQEEKEKYNVGWQHFSEGVTLGENEYIEIWNRDNILSTSSSDYVKFNITGDVEVSENNDYPNSISSLLNFSERLSSYCYYGLFKDCTGLRNTPLLPIIDLSDYCYSYMFSGCTSLINTSSLLSYNLKPSCYSNMFSGCTSLKQAPELPADILSIGCYDSMFKDCINLERTPELKATKLADFCYNKMFSGCISLNKLSSKLISSYLYNNCYANMFSGCGNLNEIQVEFLQWDETSTLNWLYQVSDSGTFIKPEQLQIKTGDSYIPEGWVIKDRSPFTINNINCVSQLSLNVPEYNSNDLQLYYRTKNTSWQKYVINTLIYLDNNDYIQFQSIKKDDFTFNQQGYRLIIQQLNEQILDTSIVTLSDDNLSGIKISGNLQSLLNYSDKCYDYCYKNMFKDCQYLIEVSNLQIKQFAAHCYQNMFENCTSLVEAPEFLFNTLFLSSSSSSQMLDESMIILYESCFQNMFKGCTNLTKTPSLPFTQLATSCYNGMFNGCTSLENAPELPAIILKQLCYKNMFSNCISLKSMPILNATTLSQYCYAYMFSGCINLKNVFDLPSLNLYSCCYQNMFEGCSSLENAPALPAITLVQSCYSGMFMECVSLIEAPYLPAQELVTSCYKNMFSGCINLNKINVQFSEWLEGATENWVYDVSPIGVFKKKFELEYKVGIDYIPVNWKYEGTPFTIFTDNLFTVVINKYGTLPNLQLFYSVDNEQNWEPYIFDENGVGEQLQINNGNIKFKNNSQYLSVDQKNYINFKINGVFDFSGDLSSLLNYNDICSDYCFYKLFYGNENLLKAPELRIRDLGISCFQSMFQSCINLKETPKLNFLNLKESCYKNMFKSCKSLIESAKLPAETLSESCYYGMFNGCSSLIDISAISAVILNKYCYMQMFKNCNSLQSTPDLPIKNMSDFCYAKMFEGCVNLKNISFLPSITLSTSCYEGMFRGCTSLINAPELPATTLATSCYESMFRSCTSLINAPELPSITLATSCYESMFRGCTSLINAPELPAIKLVDSCYSHMFNGCVLLINSPILKAQSLVNSCYEGMFKGCSSLTKVDVSFIHWHQNATLNWMENVSENGNFFKFQQLMDIRGINNIPENWIVINVNFKLSQNNIYIDGFNQQAYFNIDINIDGLDKSIIVNGVDDAQINFDSNQNINININIDMNIDGLDSEIQIDQ